MRDRSATALLIGILAVMTCLPLLHSGYTTTDDVYAALSVQEGSRSPVLLDARMSGRLQHAAIGHLTPLAYGFGHYWLMKTLALGAILGSLAALFLLMRLWTGDTRLGLLAVTFFFGFAQNTQDHNLLTAYPLVLSLSLTIFFLAVAAWWLALHGRRRMGMASLALYALNLFTYENFIVYGIVFPVLTMAAAAGPWTSRLRRAIAGTPHIALILVFLAAFVVFRLVFHLPGGRETMIYEQYTLNLDPAAVGSVLERYGAAALPLHYAAGYRNLINDYYLGFGTFRVRLFEMFEVIESAWMAKALVVAFLTAMLAIRRDVVSRNRGLLAFLAFVFMVLSHLPVALTAKYQTWVIEHFSRGYLTTYFALFGVVIFLALLVDGLVALVSRGHRWLGRVTVGVVAVAAFLTSYGTDFMNAHVALIQRQMFDRWQTVDAWIASPYFDELPEGSLVLAPTLFERYPGSTEVFDDYWTRYVHQHGKKRVEIIRQPANWFNRAREAEAGRLHYLKVMQEPRGDATFLVAARVAPVGDGALLGSDEIALLMHARSEHFRVVGRLMQVDQACRARVTVDGIPSSGTFHEYFGVHVDRVRDPEEWRWARLSSVGGLLAPESVMVTASTENVDGPVDAAFDQGFYQDEVTHRWSESESSVVLRNRAGRDVQVDVEFETRAPALEGTNGSRRLEARAAASSRIWDVGPDYEKYSIRVEVAAGSSTHLAFATDAPPVDAPLDFRRMVLMFRPPIVAREVGCERPEATPSSPAR